MMISVSRERYVFASLDAKLASALRKQVNGALGRRITRLSRDEARKNGRQLRGRQALWIIYQEYKMEGKAVGVFGLEELFKVTHTGDDLVKFLEDWELALSNLETEPDEDVLETLVIKLFRKSQKLRTDVAHWQRLEKDHPDRACQWLIACTKREVRRDWQDYVRQQMQKALGAGKPTAPAPPEHNGGKGRGRGRGAGKGPNNQPKGICFEFQNNGSCSKQNCPYEHKPGGGQSTIKGGKKGGGRGHGTAKGGKVGNNSSGVDAEGKKLCAFHAKGHCKFGDSRAHSHAAPSNLKAKAKPKAKPKAKVKVAAVALSMAMSAKISGTISDGTQTAAVPAVRNAGPGVWLGDTGSGVDLIGRNALTSEDLEDTRGRGPSVSLPRTES